eukprot:1387408-Prymnesium_polylepis.1
MADTLTRRAIEHITMSEVEMHGIGELGGGKSGGGCIVDCASRVAKTFEFTVPEGYSMCAIVCAFPNPGFEGRRGH